MFLLLKLEMADLSIFEKNDLRPLEVTVKKFSVKKKVPKKNFDV
jgi:hypothetical protein